MIVSEWSSRAAFGVPWPPQQQAGQKHEKEGKGHDAALLTREEARDEEDARQTSGSINCDCENPGVGGIAKP